MSDLRGEVAVKPTVAIVLLAAGMATRMGPNGGHKLLAEFDGMPLVRRSALTASNSHAESVTVVVGHRQDDIRKALCDLQLNVVANPDYASGLASSLVIGFVAAEANGVDGVLVMLADMPGVTSSDLNRLITVFQGGKGASIVRAVSQGKPGNPVILPRSLSDAVLRLKGDIGARDLIKASGLPVIEVEIGDAAQIDVDTPEAIIAAGGIPAEG
ncbi:NTP transferase domain-containing protein [Rhizobium leguminosarum bv. viciae]|nr:NTP transferase domain-containing protein [Rhizobium leguminosarum bv. viciae]